MTNLAERLAREVAIDRGLVPFDGAVRDSERRIADAIREAVRECARVAGLVKFEFTIVDQEHVIDADDVLHAAEGMKQAVAIRILALIGESA